LEAKRIEMTTTIAPEAMARYRRTALEREGAHLRETERRRQAAWTLARRAARLLCEEFGATRVVAFGSLAHRAWFEPRSDIDLAVEGIPPQMFWRAWGALDRLAPDVDFDLIAIESAPTRLRDEIGQQGVAL
jgi:predicted nucleotidyltransferase